MGSFFRKDISERKEFVCEGTTLKQLGYDESTGKYIYGRYHLKDCRKEWVGKLMGYEIVKPVRYKNPDGTIVGVYPSNEQFGKYGWFLPANAKDEIEKYLNK